MLAGLAYACRVGVRSITRDYLPDNTEIAAGLFMPMVFTIRTIRLKLVGLCYLVPNSSCLCVNETRNSVMAARLHHAENGSDTSKNKERKIILAYGIAMGMLVGTLI